jgi:uncharacterized membrane protein YjgN (DUF898 family)
MMTEVTALREGASPMQAVRFIGADRDFWRIVARGALLLMVTLGLYRFWLATDIRRFLWANTEVDGAYLEYAGTAIELLRGFLIAVALILPVYTVSLIAAADLGLFGSLLGGTAFLLLVFLSQSGLYLARRYRLTRTVFRGLRFRLTGSSLRYSVCAVGWWGLTALTLGFAYPFTRAALERFKMRHTHYGDLPGRFEGSGWRLFLRGGLMWLAVLLPALTGLGAMASVDWPAAMAAMRRGGDVVAQMERASPGFVAAMGTAVMAFGVCLLLGALLLPAFHALVLRWWISGLRFGDVAATSHLRTRDVYRTYLRFAGYLIGFAVLILVGIFFGLLFVGAVFGSGQSQTAEIVIVLMLVGTYVVSALGLISLYQAVVSLSLWRLAANSTALAGTAAIPSARAQGEASSPIGEGIADVLNIGGI